MDKPLKIAVYSGTIPSTTFIERLIHGLGNSGHKVLLFGSIKKYISYNSSIKNKGYRDHTLYKGLYLLFYSILLSIFKPKDKKKLDKILFAKFQNGRFLKFSAYPILWYKPDIFHLQWVRSIEDWIWVQEFGIKLVLSLRGSHINYSPMSDPALARTFKEVFPKVDAFHAVSKAIGWEAIKYNATEDKIKVIYSGLDLNEFINDVSASNPFFSIISVGRSHWKKGYHYALDACKILKDQGFQFRYTIIGLSSNMELRYQIYDLQLNDEVILTDSMTFEKVKSHLKSADMILLPSVEEGIANVVLEAMAMGKIVLSTDCGGMAEVIIDGKNGFIVPIRDPHSIAEKIKQIQNLTQEEKDMISRDSIKTISKNHTISLMITQMIDLYKNVLAE